MEDQGATAVITHHIVHGRQQAYEDWLNEIAPVCRRWPGHIDWQIIRPIEHLTFAYTIILRFDTIENLKQWMESRERKELIEKVIPLLAKNDRYSIQSGLDFLFLDAKEQAPVPVKWKQYLVTWSAIYPLSVIMPLIVLPLLRKLNLPQTRYIDSFFISGTIVLIMLYWLMPAYTRLIRKWLYK